MARKRDVIEEILVKRSRNLKRGQRWKLASRRHDALLDAFYLLKEVRSTNKPGRTELLRYIPVGLVACLEGYYRSVIRDLIDHGSPFRGNAQRLEEVKLDLPTVLRLESGAVSIGEFISHLLPISGLADINKHMSVLMHGDYLASIRVAPILEDLPESLIEVWPTVFRDIDETFRLRHITAHELALKDRPTFARTEPLLDAVLLLIMTDDTYWEARLR